MIFKIGMLVGLMAVLLTAAFVLPRFVAGRVTSIAPDLAAANLPASREPETPQDSTLTTVVEPVGASTVTSSLDRKSDPGVAQPDVTAPRVLDRPKFDEVIQPFFSSLARRDFAKARQLIDDHRDTIGADLAASMLGALTAAEAEHQRVEQLISTTKGAMETNAVELRKALDQIKELVSPKPAPTAP